MRCIPRISSLTDVEKTRVIDAVKGAGPFNVVFDGHEFIVTLDQIGELGDTYSVMASLAFDRAIEDIETQRNKARERRDRDSGR